MYNTADKTATAVGLKMAQVRAFVDGKQGVDGDEYVYLTLEHIEGREPSNVFKVVDFVANGSDEMVLAGIRLMQAAGVGFDKLDGEASDVLE